MRMFKKYVIGATIIPVPYDAVIPSEIWKVRKKGFIVKIKIGTNRAIAIEEIPKIEYLMNNLVIKNSVYYCANIEKCFESNS